MSAQTIFDNAPIGSIIAWSDGIPRPPAHRRKKLVAWHNRNSRGRLIRKQGERNSGNIALCANFTLHEADFGAGGVVAIRIHRTFALDSNLDFTLVERPEVGSVRVFDRAGASAELVHLASDRTAAEEWLSRHGYPHAVLEDVSADEAIGDVVEGRAV
ncbi:hypothetical protein [Methylovirgula sp. 4M-Z18]|uniref:hypothetical protein n=1 Tax=Methylovirgula sp. 4M-Z18 TaxID=2293567 RepID=UPI000E2EED4A|nr:hypothetical protein [Methylovirgula sp. 4M-Z18]RFB76638.1 hypothetical protein DYH55_19435 [Methylovirgula sp. 4M-Z18]